MSIVNVPKSDVIVLVAKELKKMNEFRPPAWSKFVKTGCHAERPPVNPDWWFVRVASVMSKLNDLGPVGVSKLRVKYGGKKNRGMAPERFKKGSGKIIRLILQQLEKAGFAKQTAKGLHKGRVLTPKGIAFVDKVAYQIMKEQNIVLPRKPGSQHQAESKPVEAQQPVQEQKTADVTAAGADVVSEKPKKPRAPRKKKEDALSKQSLDGHSGTSSTSVPVAEVKNG